MSIDKQLDSALAQAKDLVAGKLSTADLRTWKPAVEEPDRTIEVRSLRRRCKASQAVFAKALGVSVYAVQAWEHGKTQPSGAVSRLLQLMSEMPEVRTRLLGA